MTRRYTAEIMNVIGPQKDIPAPDMGTNEQVMAWLMDTYSQHQGHAVPAVVTGKPPELGGSVARREATGRGVVSLLPASAAHQGIPFEGAKVVIQGYGNVGRYAAIAADEMGCKVIGTSDTTGAVHNDDGLDIGALCVYVDGPDGPGGVKGFPGSDDITGDELLTLECDVLIPAAISNAIRDDNVGGVKTKIILEGANNPVTLDADRALRDEGVFIVPDVLANAGGVTASYFEWVQDIQAFFWSEVEIVKRLREIMTRAFDEVLDIAQTENVDMRTAALMKGVRRVTEAKLARGVYP